MINPINKHQPSISANVKNQKFTLAGVLYLLKRPKHFVMASLSIGLGLIVLTAVAIGLIGQNMDLRQRASEIEYQKVSRELYWYGQGSVLAKDATIEVPVKINTARTLSAVSFVVTYNPNHVSLDFLPSDTTNRVSRKFVDIADGEKLMFVLVSVAENAEDGIIGSDLGSVRITKKSSDQYTTVSFHNNPSNDSPYYNQASFFDNLSELIVLNTQNQGELLPDRRFVLQAPIFIDGSEAITFDFNSGTDNQGGKVKYTYDGSNYTDANCVANAQDPIIDYDCEIPIDSTLGSIINIDYVLTVSDETWVPVMIVSNSESSLFDGDRYNPRATAGSAKTTYALPEKYRLTNLASVKSGDTLGVFAANFKKVPNGGGVIYTCKTTEENSELGQDVVVNPIGNPSAQEFTGVCGNKSVVRLLAGEMGSTLTPTPTVTPSSELVAIRAVYDNLGFADTLESARSRYENNSGDNYCGWMGVTCDESGKVTVIDLTNQGLSGSISPEIGNLKNLIFVILASNNLTGSIPPEIGGLTDLTLIDFDNNNLEGSIPPEIGNLKKLTSIYLASNRLTGNIPPEIGNLQKLISIDLGSNRLTGNIPPEIGNLTKLRTLMLNDTDLSGPIPTSFVDAKLRWFNISSSNVCFPNQDVRDWFDTIPYHFPATADIDYCPTSGPDLVAEFINLPSNNTVAPNQPFDLTVRVTNQGDEATGVAVKTVRFTIGAGEPIKQFNHITDLAAGKYFDQTLRDFTLDKPGTYTLGASVSMVGEPDENHNNNHTEVQITVTSDTFAGGESVTVFPEERTGFIGFILDLFNL